MSIADGESPISTPLTLFLIQLLLVGVFSKVLAQFFKFIKQPTVIAEIVTGIVLGKSGFGRINGYMDKLFPQTSLTTFNVVANFGLILFMFLVGLELDVKLMKKNVGFAFAISITAITTTFLMGLGPVYVIYHTVADEGVSFSSFLLFVAVSLSITAFPVLARILTETKVLHSKVGNIVLASAAVDDVTAWCMLALVVAIAKAKSKLDALWTFLMLFGFIGIMAFLVRPLLASWANRRQPGSNAKYIIVLILLFGIFFCAWITEIIGVHAIFGAFILGVIVPRKNKFAHALTERIEDLVVIVLLPFYFTYSGLRTDIGSLKDARSWGLVVLVCTAACLGKMFGGTFAARLFAKLPWRESFSVGILLNTKGLVELIVLNVGLDVKVLNTEIFTIFVIMALFTTFLTTPLLHFVYIRKLPKEGDNPAPTSSYSVLGCVRFMKVATSIVNVSHLFVGIKESVSCKILALQEISDRPSSYFFSEFTKVFHGAKARKPLREATKAATFEVETKPFASSDLANDLVRYAQVNKSNIVLFATRTALDDSSRAVNAVNAIAKPFNRLIEDNAVKQALKTLECPIGVLVLKTGADVPKIHKVLFLYSGLRQELEALNIIKNIPAKIELKVLTAAPDIELSEREHISIERVVDVMEAFQALEKNEERFDLIVMGASRNSHSEIESPPAQKSKIPLLLIYTGVSASNSDPSGGLSLLRSTVDKEELRDEDGNSDSESEGEEEGVELP